jgi:hypothetical protein
VTLLNSFCVGPAYSSLHKHQSPLCPCHSGLIRRPVTFNFLYLSCKYYVCVFRHMWSLWSALSLSGCPWPLLVCFSAKLVYLLTTVWIIIKQDQSSMRVWSSDHLCSETMHTTRRHRNGQPNASIWYMAISGHTKKLMNWSSSGFSFFFSQLAAAAYTYWH